MLELRRVAFKQADPHVLLVHLHRQPVLYVLHRQVLPQALELADQVLVTASLLVSIEEVSQGLLEDVFGPHCVGVGPACDPQVRFLKLLAPPHDQFIQSHRLNILIDHILLQILCFDLVELSEALGHLPQSLVLLLRTRNEFQFLPVDPYGFSLLLLLKGVLIVTFLLFPLCFFLFLLLFVFFFG